MATHDSLISVSGETMLSAAEVRLLATMPLHAITVVYGEAGLRERLLIETRRLPGGQQARIDAALVLMSRLHERDRRQREPYACHYAEFRIMPTWDEKSLARTGRVPLRSA